MPSNYELNTNLLAFLKKQAKQFLFFEDGVSKLPNFGTSTGRNMMLYDGTQPFELNMKGGHLYAKPSSIASPVRYLPWVTPKGVAYMKIDPNAHIVTTAQLSGCNMYVAKIGGDTWLFHASDNSRIVTNEFFKRIMAEKAMRSLRGTSFCLSLEKGRQTFYPKTRCGGVFLGQKVVKTVDGTSAWGFYFFDVHRMKIHRLASSDAGTNATLPIAA